MLITDPTAAEVALTALVETIEATGGLVRVPGGHLAPAADEEWIDLADAYMAACMAMRRTPVVADETREGGA